MSFIVFRSGACSGGGGRCCWNGGDGGGFCCNSVGGGFGDSSISISRVGVAIEW